MNVILGMEKVGSELELDAVSGVYTFKLGS